MHVVPPAKLACLTEQLKQARGALIDYSGNASGNITGGASAREASSVES